MTFEVRQRSIEEVSLRLCSGESEMGGFLTELSCFNADGSSEGVPKIHDVAHDDGFSFLGLNFDDLERRADTSFQAGEVSLYAGS